MLNEKSVVWCHHLIKQDSGFRFFRESVTDHRNKHSGRPIPAGAGCELIAYEPSDGAQRCWYLVATIPGDGTGESVDRPGFPCIYVDPLTLTAPPVATATANACEIMRQRNERAGVIVVQPQAKPGILSRWFKGLMK
jgi:hypothetical protein